MADNIPYIVMAFANADDDLQYLREEERLLSRKLLSRRTQKRDFDFYPIPFATRDDVLQSFADLREQKPCFFHFSGHSNGIVLKLNDTNSTAVDLSRILSDDHIKIMFLNACSSSGLVKDIFANTKVKAVIATRCPVDDERAKLISLEFYKHFIIDGFTLQASFDKLMSLEKYSQSSIDIKKSNTREIGWDIAKKLDDEKQFSWGIFYSDAEIFSCRFTDLAGERLEALEKLKTGRATTKEQLDQYKAILQQTKPTDAAYATMETLTAKAKDAYEKALEDLRKFYARENDEEEIATEQQKQQQLQEALRKLNYKPQRTNYKLEPNTFGCISMPGDPYSFHELLYDNFKFENFVRKPDTFECIVDGSSRNFEGFWKTLALKMQLDIIEPVDTGDLPSKEKIKNYYQSIIKKLLEDYYFQMDQELVDQRPTKRDVLIKIKTGAIPADDWITILTDFWKEVQEYINTCPYKPVDQSPLKWHKFAILLLDESSTKEKQELLEDKLTTIPFSMPSLFRVLDPIQSLDESDLTKWIEDNQLHMVGFSEKNAKQWFRDSDNGKLIKVIYLIKNETKFDNVDIFKLLMAEPIRQEPTKQ